MANLGILIVEDSSTMRQVAQIAFAGTPHQVWIVSTIPEAQAVLAGKKVDLAILDAGLSGDAAYDFVRSVRQERRSESPKFLLWTSQYHPLQETLAAQVGVDASMNKPFEIQALLDKVSGLFAAEAVASHTQVGIPVAHPIATVPPVSATAPSTPTVTPPRAPAPTTVTPAVVPARGAATLPSVPATPAPSTLPEMPRVPFLPRAPVPVSVIAVLEGLAKKSQEHRDVVQVGREVIERIAWEVVPALAEVLLQEEIQRRMADRFAQKEESR